MRSTASASGGYPAGRTRSTAAIVSRSISSKVDGMIPEAMTAETARPASRSSSKIASRVMECSVTGVSLSETSVTVPRVPSLPMSRESRSGPERS